MKRFIRTLLPLASACVLGAEQPDDGVYLRARGEPAPWIRGQDGRKLFLGARQTLAIRKCELLSQNNANTKFRLSVTVPYDKSIGLRTYVLIVAGTAYRQTASGSSQQKTSSLCFHVLGEDNGKRVSEYLKTPLVYRRHPGHNLRVSFTPTQQEFAVGDEVTATLQVTNVGTDRVAFMKGGRNRAARDNQHVFSARQRGRQVDDIGTSCHRGGWAQRRVLKPGEVFEDQISLSKWFAFERPGMYQIHGSYYLAFTDPDAESWRTIWEDYVSADFIVRIKQPERASNRKVTVTR